MKKLNEEEIFARLHAKKEDPNVSYEEIVNPDYEIWGQARQWYPHQGICLVAGLAPIAKYFFDALVDDKLSLKILIKNYRHYSLKNTDLNRLQNINRLLNDVEIITFAKKNNQTIRPKDLLFVCKNHPEISSVLPSILIKAVETLGPNPSLNLPNTFSSLEIHPEAIDTLRKLKERETKPLALNSAIKEDTLPKTPQVPPTPPEAPLLIAKRLFPLKNIERWEKADVVSWNEIILLHYEIDPERIDETHLPREPIEGVRKEFLDYLNQYFFGDRQLFVNQLDKDKLVDLLQRSIHAGLIQPSAQNTFLKAEIVEWMASKDMAFPLRVDPHDGPSKTEISKEEILNYDLKRMDKDQLAKLITRCVTAILWKNAQTSTLQQIRKLPPFKKNLAFVQELIGKKEPFEEKTVEDWIRNLRPNYKSKK